MTMIEGFVAEVCPVDTLTPGPVLAGDVSSLDHEVRDDTVDFGSLVPELGLKSSNVPDGRVI